MALSRIWWNKEDETVFCVFQFAKEINCVTAVRWFFWWKFKKKPPSKTTIYFLYTKKVLQKVGSHFYRKNTTRSSLWTTATKTTNKVKKNTVWELILTISLSTRCITQGMMNINNNDDEVIQSQISSCRTRNIYQLNLVYRWYSRCNLEMHEIEIKSWCKNVSGSFSGTNCVI